MTDFEYAVFRRVETKVKEKHHNALVLCEYSPEPPSLPCVMFTQSDNRTYENSQLGDGIDHHVSVMYSADAYSSKMGGGQAECKSILSAVDEAMRSIGFQRTMDSPMDNMNRTISRRVARYSGVIGEDGIVYRK